MIENKFILDEPPVAIYNRKKQDYIRIPLSAGTSTRLNSDGDLIFEVDNQQSYIYLPDSFLYAEFSLYEDAALTTVLPEATNITLEHNFFPSLFSSMRLEVGTQKVETISESPGLIDTILRTVTITKEDQIKYQDEGWIPDTGSGNLVNNLAPKGGTAADEAKPTKGEYDAIVSRLNKDTKNTGYSRRRELYNKYNAKNVIQWRLSPLFGYLDYTKISYQLKYKLVLHRTINNEQIFYGAAGKKAYFKLDKLEFWIPQIDPSLDIEIMIEKRLNKKDPIPVTFSQRLSSTYSIDARETTWHFSRVSNTPRFLFLALQKDEPASFQSNNTRFFLWDPADEITSIQVLLNQTRYPIDPMRFDRTTNNYLEGYDAYRNACKKFGTSPQLSPLEWRNIYPIFCFDLTAQNEDIIKNGCDLTIKIIKKNNVKFRVYAVTLLDAKHFIELNDGRMVRVY